MNRGSTIDNRGHVVGHDASMRPRFMNRGSPIGMWTDIETRLASMRPRFMNRGSWPPGAE